MEAPKLTPTEQRVYDALDDTFRRPWSIACKVGFRNMSPSERADHFCIRLVKKGLAEKAGSRMFPEWRRAQPPK